MRTIEISTEQATTDTAHDEKDAHTLSLFHKAAAAESAESNRIRERIVLDHLGLAEAMARRVSHGGGASGSNHPGGDWADLRQVAYLGLIKASRRFTPERGASFAAFAVPTIIGELKRHLRDLGWTIRPPRGLQELHRRCTAVAEELTQELRRQPTELEIARRLGVEASEVAEALSLGHPLSLDEPVSATGTRLVDTLGGDDDERLLEIDRRYGLADALAELEEGERELLRLRFVEERTQKHIADALGTTQMQISRLQRRILAQLAVRLGSPAHHPQPGTSRDRIVAVTPVGSIERLRSA
ncbi:sigma-70 family RNA polymerase sigma factor [Rathayibacter toxicus]|uniref:sigma-70 family RNA polymerase sigma factor n=1 Tax=Rathayibacter toxicus TaxID=145458 RepID=UPI000CE838CA|nr:sigma-70 family RNA polymerase sigma factor [Rathayibacter toxicus]PPI55694.1 hypothetical protein C5D35_04075 [Rathayibacter toxicus]QOD09813.1 sigma-70 family RNA polymerase sigma factor [Rathayibacter toxicus]QWL28477.1 sigma-70 family RNA polymerase sigma factor [Rathayibacter toxicus]QWL32668.1 sigma-70 family RNA polymerase sigma factor [Rathayibacter toxicus]QWL34763.1 sigma-70 family RNA polymerase sigma factor [Rathayibacter toxicus]